MGDEHVTSKPTPDRILAVIAEAIRSVDLDSMTRDDIAAMLELGDVADAEARAVLVALNLAGYAVVPTAWVKEAIANANA